MNCDRSVWFTLHVKTTFNNISLVHILMCPVRMCIDQPTEKAECLLASDKRAFRAKNGGLESWFPWGWILCRFLGERSLVWVGKADRSCHRQNSWCPPLLGSIRTIPGESITSFCDTTKSLDTVNIVVAAWRCETDQQCASRRAQLSESVAGWGPRLATFLLPTKLATYRPVMDPGNSPHHTALSTVALLCTYKNRNRS